MNKKGVQPEVVIIVLVLFVLIAFILLRFTYSTSSSLKEDADIETCRLSVLAQAQARKVPIVGVSSPKSPISLDCPRRNLKIFENKVELNGKRFEKYDFKKLTEEEVNKIIAEELRLCWYKMLEGKQVVFEENYFFNDQIRVCLICSEISFDDKLNVEISGLKDYLHSKNIPKSNMKYYDYLTRSQRDPYLVLGIPWAQYTPWGIGITSYLPEERIISNQKYLIYFHGFKPSALSKAFGQYTQAYYIGLVREDSLKNTCQISVN